MRDSFVIHLHTGWGPAHYDLMLARGEASATWRVGSSPAGLAPGEGIPAARLADHRAAYLTYEGPVSGGRGRVERVDRGRWELLADEPGRWEFRLAGTACRGRFELALRDEARGEWTLTRRAD